jgi:hypothetical protein
MPASTLALNRHSHSTSSSCFLHARDSPHRSGAAEKSNGGSQSFRRLEFYRLRRVFGCKYIRKNKRGKKKHVCEKISGSIVLVLTTVDFSRMCLYIVGGGVVLAYNDCKI